MDVAIEIEEEEPIIREGVGGIWKKWKALERSRKGGDAANRALTSGILKTP